MASTSEASGFTEAVARFLDERPDGYEHVLPRLAELERAYFDALGEGTDSPYHRGAEQFEPSHVHAALVRIAGLSAAAGGFRRPCCSEYPFIWPLCNATC